MQRKDNHFIVNEIAKFGAQELKSGKIIEKNGDQYTFQYKGKNYKVNIVQQEENSFILKIEGYRMKVEAKDQLDILIEKLGLNKVKAQNISVIKAPMPGLVLDILVSPGQTVQKGDNLIILEAMKMENIIKAEGDGIVKSVEVNKSDKVDKGQLMIDME